MSTQYYCFYALCLLLVAAFAYLGPQAAKQYAASRSNLDSPVSAGMKAQEAQHAMAKPTNWYRQMFHKLHNLEDNVDILQSARDELLAMLSKAISLTFQKPRGSIFEIENYSPDKVEEFMKMQQQVAMDNWSRYLDRRDRGAAPELFGTVEAAKEWLENQAPNKFVDGAWLAHLHKLTTPFALRTVTKNAWQVLSEELGDGDLSKHHVYLYRKLLESVGINLPQAESLEFVELDSSLHMKDHRAWEAAVSQLLISLFPDEFLPEILGFNMHFELITMETLLANHELKALGIDPYYFLIHIVIDNADSGHTAMATHVVTQYLDMIKETEGQAAAHQAWKRVQAGYVLSQTAGSPMPKHEPLSAAAALNLSLDPLSAHVLKIFKSKAAVSHQLHCQSRVRIGGQTLSDWLAPDTWSAAHPERKMNLLTALSRAKPWIQPGASKKSLFMRELAWEGRMFGAFTHDETAALASWIDSLGPDGSALLYWNFTHRRPMASADVVGKLRDPVRHHPVIMPRDARLADPDCWGLSTSDDSVFRPAELPLSLSSTSRLPDVVALWFAHIALLENIINTPARTADPLYAMIIYYLRAQAGFDIEKPIVAGMDELKRDYCPSLVELGREMVVRAGWTKNTQVECLHDVFAVTARQGQGQQSRQFASDIMSWATRPQGNLGLLLGMAWAFTDFKKAVAKMPGVLSHESRILLEAIVRRERQSLEGCVETLQTRAGKPYTDLNQGNRIARAMVQQCCG